MTGESHHALFPTTCVTGSLKYSRILECQITGSLKHSAAVPPMIIIATSTYGSTEINGLLEHCEALLKVGEERFSC